MAIMRIPKISSPEEMLTYEVKKPKRISSTKTKVVMLSITLYHSRLSIISLKAISKGRPIPFTIAKKMMIVSQKNLMFDLAEIIWGCFMIAASNIF